MKFEQPRDKKRTEPSHDTADPLARPERETLSERERGARVEHDQEALGDARRALEAPGASEAERGPQNPYRQDLYGAFAAARRREGKIVLEADAADAVKQAMQAFHREAKRVNNFVAGEKIAAEYDTKTGNFRTQTRIAVLPDGRKVFMLYDYAGSWIHRFLDGMMKRANRLPMRKVGRGAWKARHEAMTSIPVIETADPHMAVMPLVPNANAKDVFANNAEIKDFGACAWAKAAGLEEKNVLVEKIADEMRRYHEEKGGWGEAVLSNVIFTEEQRATLCDFEVAYDEDVPMVERKARDLKDMCLSIAAALEKAHGQDASASVKTLLDRYGDAEVIDALKKLASAKRGWFRKLFFGYELARTGAKNKAQYDAVLKAIMEYASPQPQ